MPWTILILLALFVVLAAELVVVGVRDVVWRLRRRRRRRVPIEFGGPRL